MGGDKPQAPEAPDIGKSTKESLEAYVENYPEIADLMLKYQPQFDRAGIQGGIDRLFAGQDATAESMNRYGDDIMDAVFNLENKYGSALNQRYVQNMRDADPTYFNVRDAYGQKMQDNLALGNTLSDEQTRLVQQSTRAGQDARGNIRGYAPSVQETMKSFLAGESLQDKRLGQAQQYMSTPAPGISMGNTASVMQAYRGQPMPNFSSQQLNPNQGMQAGQQGANMAQQQYGQQYSGYQNAMANYQSPWATAAQLGMAGASLFAMCWVAREVYGESNPKWLQFREWVLTMATDKFRNWYINNGEEYANHIKDKPAAKDRIRRIMNDKILELEGVKNAS